ncbi:PH domain-containing protein [Haloarcula nitratireducens]|uniref:PH domain-containing protein n=1 Tax=Haloarcula nitratireducens TaxID=2487749 RepID=A0AAW4P9R6_9EURY|nr:PH domain-containing protein [Halomicroarcula nitratireducens]MBX0294328.1 PH domain-containing protein [Halomicroarcula nitratireducens]
MESLHPRVRLLWAGRTALSVSVLAGIAVLVNRFAVSLPLTAVVVLWGLLVSLGAVHAVLAHRIWRFELQDDALFLVRGVLTRTDTSVPYVRVQHVDTTRGPIERTAGLASVVVYTAGSRGADITVPGLRPERATELRERLRDLAIESEATDAV